MMKQNKIKGLLNVFLVLITVLTVNAYIYDDDISDFEVGIIVDGIKDDSNFIQSFFIDQGDKIEKDTVLHQRLISENIDLSAYTTLIYDSSAAVPTTYPFTIAIKDNTNGACEYVGFFGSTTTQITTNVWAADPVVTGTVSLTLGPEEHIFSLALKTTSSDECELYIDGTKTQFGPGTFPSKAYYELTIYPSSSSLNNLDIEINLSTTIIITAPTPPPVIVVNLNFDKTYLDMPRGSKDTIIITGTDSHKVHHCKSGNDSIAECSIATLTSSSKTLTVEAQQVNQAKVTNIEILDVLNNNLATISTRVHLSFSRCNSVNLEMIGDETVVVNEKRTFKASLIPAGCQTEFKSIEYKLEVEGITRFLNFLDPEVKIKDILDTEFEVTFNKIQEAEEEYNFYIEAICVSCGGTVVFESTKQLVKVVNKKSADSIYISGPDNMDPLEQMDSRWSTAEEANWSIKSNGLTSFLNSLGGVVEFKLANNSKTCCDNYFAPAGKYTKGGKTTYTRSGFDLIVKAGSLSTTKRISLSKQVGKKLTIILLSEAGKVPVKGANITIEDVKGSIKETIKTGGNGKAVFYAVPVGSELDIYLDGALTVSGYGMPDRVEILELTKGVSRYVCTGIIILEGDKLYLDEGSSQTLNAQLIPKACDDTNMEYKWTVDDKLNTEGKTKKLEVSEDVQAYNKYTITANYDGSDIEFSRMIEVVWGQEQVNLGDYWISGPDWIYSGGSLQSTASRLNDWILMLKNTPTNGNWSWDYKDAFGRDFLALNAPWYRTGCCSVLTAPDKDFKLSVKVDNQVIEKQIEVRKRDSVTFTITIKDGITTDGLPSINITLVDSKEAYSLSYKNTGTTDNNGKVKFNDVPKGTRIDIYYSTGIKATETGYDALSNQNIEITYKRGVPCEAINIEQGEILSVEEGVEFILKAEPYPVGCDKKDIEYSWSVNKKGNFMYKNIGEGAVLTHEGKSKGNTYLYTVEAKYENKDGWEDTIEVFVGDKEQQLDDYWITGPDWVYSGAEFIKDEWYLVDKSGKKITTSWGIIHEGIKKGNYPDRLGCCEGAYIRDTNFELQAELEGGSILIKKEIEVKERDLVKLTIIVEDEVTKTKVKDATIIVEDSTKTKKLEQTDIDGKVELDVIANDLLTLTITESGNEAFKEQFKVIEDTVKSINIHQSNLDGSYVFDIPKRKIVQIDPNGMANFNIEVKIIDSYGQHGEILKVLYEFYWKSNEPILYGGNKLTWNSPSRNELKQAVFSGDEVYTKEFNLNVSSIIQITTADLWIEGARKYDAGLNGNFKGDLQSSSDKILLTLVPNGVEIPVIVELSAIDKSTILSSGETGKYKVELMGDTSDCSNFAWEITKEGSVQTNVLSNELFGSLEFTPIYEGDYLLSYNLSCSDGRNALDDINIKVLELKKSSLIINLPQNSKGYYLAKPGEEFTVTTSERLPLDWSVIEGKISTGTSYLNDQSKDTSKDTFKYVTQNSGFIIIVGKYGGEEIGSEIIESIDVCSSYAKLGSVSITVKDTDPQNMPNISISDGQDKLYSDDTLATLTVNKLPLCRDLIIKVELNGIVKEKTIRFEDTKRVDNLEFSFASVYENDCKSDLTLMLTENTRQIKWSQGGYGLCKDKCYQKSDYVDPQLFGHQQVVYCCDGNLVVGKTCDDKLTVELVDENDNGITYASIQKGDTQEFSAVITKCPDNATVWFIVKDNNGADVERESLNYELVTGYNRYFSFSSTDKDIGRYTLEAIAYCNNDQDAEVIDIVQLDIEDSGVINLIVDLNKKDGVYTALPGRYVKAYTRGDIPVSWELKDGSNIIYKLTTYNSEWTFKADPVGKELLLRAISPDGKEIAEETIRVLSKCENREREGEIEVTITNEGVLINASEISYFENGSKKEVKQDLDYYEFINVPVCTNIDIKVEYDGITKSKQVLLQSSSIKRSLTFDFKVLDRECDSLQPAKDGEFEWGSSKLALCGSECLSEKDGYKFCCSGATSKLACNVELDFVDAQAVLKVGETKVFDVTFKGCENTKLTFIVIDPKGGELANYKTGDTEYKFTAPANEGEYTLEVFTLCDGNYILDSIKIDVISKEKVSISAPTNVDVQKEFTVSLVGGGTADWTINRKDVGLKVNDNDMIDKKQEFNGEDSLSLEATSSGEITISAELPDTGLFGTNLFNKKDRMVTITINDECASRLPQGVINGEIKGLTGEISYSYSYDSKKETGKTDTSGIFSIKDIPFCTDITISADGNQITQTATTRSTGSNDIGQVILDFTSAGIQDLCKSIPQSSGKVFFTNSLALCGDICYNEVDITTAGRDPNNLYCCSGSNQNKFDLSNKQCTQDDWCTGDPVDPTKLKKITADTCQCGDNATDTIIAFCNKDQYCYKPNKDKPIDCFDKVEECKDVYKSGSTYKDNLTVTEICGCDGTNCGEDQLCVAEGSSKCYDAVDIIPCDIGVSKFKSTGGFVDASVGICTCGKDECPTNGYCYEKKEDGQLVCGDEPKDCKVTKFGTGISNLAGSFSDGRTSATVTALTESCKCDESLYCSAKNICYEDKDEKTRSCITPAEKENKETYLKTDCTRETGIPEKEICVCEKEKKLFEGCNVNDYCRADGSCEDEGETCVKGDLRCDGDKLYKCQGVLTWRWELKDDCSTLKDKDDNPKSCLLTHQEMLGGQLVWYGGCFSDEKKCEELADLTVFVNTERDEEITVELIDTPDCEEQLKDKKLDKKAQTTDKKVSFKFSDMPLGSYKISAIGTETMDIIHNLMVGEQTAIIDLTAEEGCRDNLIIPKFNDIDNTISITNVVLTNPFGTTYNVGYKGSGSLLIPSVWFKDSEDKEQYKLKIYYKKDNKKYSVDTSFELKGPCNA